MSSFKEKLNGYYPGVTCAILLLWLSIIIVFIAIKATLIFVAKNLVWIIPLALISYLIVKGKISGRK